MVESADVETKSVRWHMHITRKFAAATYGLIALNVAIFIGSSRFDPTQVFTRYGVVPSDLTLASMFTSLFIHGDYVHLLANMLFLWMFGRSVEFVMGGVEYLLFYIGSGFVSSIVHVAIVALFALRSDVPVVGASGAIAGILGVYAIRFHRRKLKVGKYEIPALLVLFAWLIVQAVLGFVSLYVTTYHVRSVQVNLQSVGYWSHIGGFVFGMVIAQLARMDVQGHKDYLFNKIRLQLERGALLDALRTSDDLVRYDPADPNALAEMGHVWALLNDREQSLLCYRRAIAGYLKIGEGQKAWNRFRELRHFWGGAKVDTASQYRLACYLEETANYTETVESLKELAAESPESAEAQMALLKAGQVQMSKMKSPQEARDTLQRLIKSYPYGDYRKSAERLLERTATAG